MLIAVAADRPTDRWASRARRRGTTGTKILLAFLPCHDKLGMRADVIMAANRDHTRTFISDTDTVFDYPVFC